MTEEEKIDRDYTDIYTIKDFAFNTLAPKYFPDTEISDLNIGLTGLTMEQIANFTEDTFRTVSTLINEAYPNRAQIPENIYSHAAIFQLESNFASAASCPFILAIREEDVMQYSVGNGDHLQFYLDANTQITVNGTPYSLDYDIIIKAQKHQGEYIFTAQYDMSYDNSISLITNRYIKIRRMKDGFLYMYVTLHQVIRDEQEESIINNSKINYPRINCDFKDQLAGFDVFYKEPGSDREIQMTKRVLFSAPLKTPFCYYKFKNADILNGKPTEFMLTFSTKDAYFQPEFNSTLRIVKYITKGLPANFDVYTGNDVQVITSGDKYEYNAHCIVKAAVTGGSLNGNDSITVDELRDIVVENYSTATVISTENDLRLYFDDYSRNYGNKLLFIKRRDDIERLFSAFLVMKKEDYIYPTNTLDIRLSPEQADYVNNDSTEIILKPGHLLKYIGDSLSEVEVIPGVMCYDDKEKIAEALTSAFEGEDPKKDQFVYTNPFLIKINKSPNSIGYYMNITSERYPLISDDVDLGSFMQFITTDIMVERGLSDKAEFDITVNITPSAEVDPEESPITIGQVEGNYVKAILVFMKGGTHLGYIEMTPIAMENDVVTFNCALKTSDIVTSSATFETLNLTNTLSNEVENIFIDTSDCVARLYTLHYNPDLFEKDSELFGNKDYVNYVVTNVYNTSDNPITFIRPMNMIRSTVKFEATTNPLVSVPLIKYDIPMDRDKFNYFVSSFTNQYMSFENIRMRLENNMHIDVKFYNTYGRSKNYYIGDKQERIDKVNLTIKFSITVINGADEGDVIRDTKNLIKSYVETLNSDGTNELYISNLITKMETDLPEIDHCKFLGINDYSTDYQTITRISPDINLLPRDERRSYVPEMLVIDADNIKLSTNSD